MSLVGLILVAAVAVVTDGKPAVRLEHDGSPRATAAAELIQRHVVRMAKTALPDQGAAAALRFEQSRFDGYRRRIVEGNLVIDGRDPLLAAYDVLRDWGCRFDSDEPFVPQATTLAIEATTWSNDRPLVIEAEQLDASFPATALAIRGLDRYQPTEAPPPHELRVISTTFDDFLPPALFEQHRDYFALRKTERVARGNFALTNTAARKAYLDRMGAWLKAHPHVDVLGIWPEVTSVWCEESLRLGAHEAYALLWREAAATFPNRRFEILATGETERPPKGRVPPNVEVRFRPTRGASLSLLQPIAAQPSNNLARAWEVRGAKLLLEIDGAPPTWCGLPWPCHDAVRGNARRFHGAVLVHPRRALAELWHRPDSRVAIDEELAALLTRARTIKSWGDPRDAALLWPTTEGAARTELGARMGEVERGIARARTSSLAIEKRRAALNDAWFGFRALVHDLGEPHGTMYRRLRSSEFRNAFEEILPAGASKKIAGADVRETFEAVTIQTPRLRLGIERRTGLVTELRRKLARDWSPNLAGPGGRMFAVVALGSKTDRVEGVVRVRAGAEGSLLVELSGRVHRGGPRWSCVLTLDGSSARIGQRATVNVPGGIAVGCQFGPTAFDEWVCPSYAREGRFQQPAEARQATFRLVPGSVLYCRKAPRGVGLALRLPNGGAGAVVDGDEGTILSTSSGATLDVEWIVFTGEHELAK